MRIDDRTGVVAMSRARSSASRRPGLAAIGLGLLALAMLTGSHAEGQTRPSQQADVTTQQSSPTNAGPAAGQSPAGQSATQTAVEPASKSAVRNAGEARPSGPEKALSHTVADSNQTPLARQVEALNALAIRLEAEIGQSNRFVLSMKALRDSETIAASAHQLKASAD